MKHFLFVGWLLAVFVSSSAQVVDDFSDGDFTANPVWTGNEAQFVVSAGQLRSNAGVPPATIEYYLSTPSGTVLQAQWEFFVNLRFATSAQNLADVYLTSDQAILTAPGINGYFVRIGDTADEVALYRVTAGTATRLAGVPGIVNSSSNNPFRIRVTRDADDRWTLDYDDGATGTYVTGPSVTDNTHGSSQFFGIKIRQSTASSAANNHFFDDITVGPIPTDTAPPELQSAQAINANQLLVTFSEPLEPTSAQTPSHYQVAPAQNTATAAMLQPAGISVVVTFAQAFPNGIEQQLTVTNVADVAGNAMPPRSVPFRFFQASPVFPKDIIITEMLPDPVPQVGLPNAEYIEIHNRSAHPIDLLNWQLSDESSTATFPSHIVLPGSYWVVTSTTTAGLFTGPVIGVSNFPTLNNSGDVLVLRDAARQRIDSLRYDLTWYRDQDKQEGGWALELIDPNNPCGEADNWTASEDPNGGTPGRQNSVFANKPDLTGPQLLSAVAESETTVRLSFNEKMEGQLSADEIVFEPTLAVASVAFHPALRSALVQLASSLQPRVLYHVTVTSARDCNGNEIQEPFSRQSFAVTEAAQPGDILLNEILFNPFPGGSDFVELYNVSDKFINLRNWRWKSASGDEPITVENLVMAPQSYRVFTADPLTVQTHYPSHERSNFFQCRLPSMPDDEGSIALVAEDAVVVDQFAYQDDYHSPLIDDEEGVSLERISWAEPTQSPANWKSAASVVGFGTPGRANSHARGDTQTQDAVTVSPMAFSPRLGFAQIQFSFEQSGLNANVTIIDQRGHIVKTIATNATLGFQGFFRWDGDTDRGDQARSGYYAVWFETFDADGNVKRYRTRVVIAE